MGRIECELHQQVLESRRGLDCLQAEVNELHHIWPHVQLLKNGLDETMRSLEEVMHSKMAFSTSQLQDDLHQLTKNVQKELRTATHEMDLKVERLTAVVGTAAFFTRGSHNQVDRNLRVDRIFRPEEDEDNPHASENSHTPSISQQTTKNGDKPPEALQRAQPDVHEMLKSLCVAVQALQRHLRKTNTDIDHVREECNDMRLKLRHQEVSSVTPSVKSMTCLAVLWFSALTHVMLSTGCCAWVLGVMVCRKCRDDGAGSCTLEIRAIYAGKNC